MRKATNQSFSLTLRFLSLSFPPPFPSLKPVSTSSGEKKKKKEYSYVQVTVWASCCTCVVHTPQQSGIIIPNWHSLIKQICDEHVLSLIRTLVVPGNIAKIKTGKDPALMALIQGTWGRQTTHFLNGCIV